MSDLTAGEKKANKAILDAMRDVLRIDDEELAFNREEVTEAIHVLQSVVKQHVLHRIMPKEYSNWFVKT